MELYYLPQKGFYIGGLEIRFYGIIMALSMLAGILLACKLGKKRGVKSDDIIMLALIVLPVAVIGARLYYCIFYTDNYSFKEFFNLKGGGLAIYGGVIGGIVSIIIFSVIKKDFKLILTLFDVCVPCLILGQAMGRWGNFFNQEAYGNLVANSAHQWFPLSVYIKAENFTPEARTQVVNAFGSLKGIDGAWFQATFFYESLWNFIGLAILLVIYYKTKATGLTTAGYLVWYGLGRLWIEGLRTDSLYIGSSSIRVSQLLSAIMVLIGVVIIVYHIVKAYLSKNKQNKKNT